MLHYITQIIVFQFFFLIVYDVFLKNETFFNWNRLYLLLTAGISFVLPFIKIPSLSSIIPKNYVFNLPKFSSDSNETIILEEVVLGSNTSSWYSSILTIETIFYLGIFLSCIFFIYKITKLFVLIYKNPIQKKRGLNIINLSNSTAAFSFFNYVFLGDNIKQEDRTIILNHELIHVQQMHTLDLIFFEVFRILFWFNPLLYIYQNRIEALHEYIADAKIVKHQSKVKYYENLLAQVFEVKHISFVNSFFKQSLIKKRIIMLSKSKSNQFHLLKYAIIIPMVLGMIIYTSCSDQKSESEVSVQNDATKKTQGVSMMLVRIDALKSEIEVKGVANDQEAKALNILAKILKSDELDPKIIEKMQSLFAIKDKSPILEKTVALLDQIQVQGNITNEETKALGDLLLLIRIDEISQDIAEKGEMSFNEIDVVPIFPSCDASESNEDKKACFNAEIKKFVALNFNLDIANDKNLSGIQKIFVRFVIDTDGSIIDIKVRAPHELLKEEAIRIVKLLPKMVPGKHDGENVKVPYYLPIKFKIKE